MCDFPEVGMDRTDVFSATETGGIVSIGAITPDLSVVKIPDWYPEEYKEGLTVGGLWPIQTYPRPDESVPLVTHEEALAIMGYQLDV